jgi:DNA-binding Lrp family transcriptional regulator
MSNKELASAVNLAPSSCWERVKQLQEDGVVRGYRADLDPRALGIGLQAMVAVRLDRHSLSEVEHFRNHLQRSPEVMAIYHVGGVNDFLLHVGATDSDHLREIILKTFASRPEVIHMETSIIFEYTKSDQLPVFCSIE